MPQVQMLWALMNETLPFIQTCITVCVHLYSLLLPPRIQSPPSQSPRPFAALAPDSVCGYICYPN